MQRLLQPRLRRLELATGLLQLGAVFVILEPHQHLSLLHLLAFAHEHLGYSAVHLRRHLNLMRRHDISRGVEQNAHHLCRALPRRLDSLHLNFHDPVGQVP